MLTEEEKSFMAYWEANRNSQKKLTRQLLLGIPIGLLFAVPIAINFFSGWYKRAAMEANVESFNPLVLLVALVVIVAFIAIFSRKYRWEMNEQRFKELQAKKSNNDKE